MAAHLKPPQSPHPLADARLKIARAEAIDAYGGLEISLSRIFADLLGTKPDLAGIVLFRIGNSRARNKMIELLIKRKYGAKFNLYWNSVFKLIGQLDNRRNEIVHWNMSVRPNFGRSGKLTSATAKLFPPNIWDRRRGKQSLNERDLFDFVLRCEFAEAAVWSFLTFLVIHGGNAKLRAAWRGIFQQPLVYPPVDDHPICLRWPKHRILLRPARL
ncbi:MAG TPA: hypothetical protein VE111_04865 [Bradyrhizobium sp.]|nr:hypothetical protein [Bradyrhizobium sp.]